LGQFELAGEAMGEIMHLAAGINANKDDLFLY
jgi:hypothetical protein